MFGLTRVFIGAVSLLGVVGLILAARGYWINEGKLKCQNAVAAAAQERVLKTDDKLRTVRARRPDIDYTANRLRDGTF